MSSIISLRCCPSFLSASPLLHVSVPTNSSLPQFCPHKNVSWAKIAPYRILQLASAGPSSPVRWILSDDLSHNHNWSHSSCRGRSITTAPLLDFAQRHVSKGLNHLTEEVIVKGEGPWVTMHNGRRLLDFTSGIGVTNLGASRDLLSNHSRETDSQGKPGHCHPKVSKAAAEQCLNLVHGQVSSFPSLHHSSPSERRLVQHRIP